MTTKLNGAVNEKGRFGVIIRKYPHNIIIEEKGKYEYSSYGSYFSFGNVYFVYELDVCMDADVRTRLFFDINQAEEYAQKDVKRINKEQEKLNHKIDHDYQIMQEWLKLDNADIGTEDEFGTIVKKFPGLVYLSKRAEDSFVVYERESERMTIGFLHEFNNEADATRDAEEYSKAACAFQIEREKSMILKDRILRRYGIIIKEFPYDIKLSLKDDIFILYRVNKENDVISSEVFCRQREAEKCAEKWIKKLKFTRFFFRNS